MEASIIDSVISEFCSSAAFQQAMTIRSCTGFNPALVMQVVWNEHGNADITMRPEGKAQWFHLWCAQNEHIGKILTDVVSVDTIGTDIIFIKTKASVIINDILVSEDVAGRAIHVTDLNALDNAIQICASVAKGRALSNAGFGAGTSIYNIQLPSQPLPNEQHNELPLPFDMPAQNVQQNVPAQLAGNPADSGMVTAPGQKPGCSGNQMAGTSRQSDPVTSAKMMMWPFSGELAGKTLGEILLTSPNKIIWLAGYRRTSPEYRNAAELLKAEAAAQMGQAI